MKKMGLLLTLICTCGFAQYEVIEDQCSIQVKTVSMQDIQRRKIVLANGLKAYIISDPKATKSSAALSVAAGQWNDPKQYPGTAHFLEHMLFMGTKRFPDEEAYHKFVQDHGGSNNAYTAYDRTVYGASINNEYFVEFLDRLADFFVDPLLSTSGVEREFKAVDNENTNCKAHDGWRSMRVISETANPDHPFSSFAVGNAETLGNIPPETLREWFENHYSAESMNLVVYSPLPLDTLSKTVDEAFSLVPTRKTAAPYQSNLLDIKQKGHLIVIKPLKDIKEVEVLWEMPSNMNDTHTFKMLQCIAKTLNSKEPGSLYHELYQKKAIEDVHAHAIRWSKNNNLFGISVTLTDWGLNNREWVVDTIFQTINMLKQEGVPEYIFDELHTMQKLGLEFDERPSNPFGMAMQIADQLQSEPIETFPEKTYLPDWYDPKLISDLLEQFTPQNGCFTLTAQLADFEYDRVEPYYEVAYSLMPMDQARLDTLASIELNDDIQIPQKNPFIPRDLNIIERTSQIPHKEPYLLLRNQEGMLYHMIDNTFLTPEAQIHFAISTPAINPSLESIVMMDVVQELIDDKLKMTASLAQNGGIRVGVQTAQDKLLVSVGGYSEKAPEVTLDIVGELKNLSMSSNELDYYKELIKIGYLNSKKELPVRYGFDIVRAQVYEGTFLPDEKLATLESLQLNDVQRFVAHLFDRTYLRSYITGNLSQNEAVKLFCQVGKELKSEPLAFSEIPQAKFNPIDSQKKLEQTSESLGYSSILMMQLGEYTPTKAGILRLLQTAIHTDYFDELRSRQQLGYIVASQGVELRNHLNLYFYVQSGNYSSNELYERTQVFIDDWLTNLEKMLSEERFEQLKQTALIDLRMPYNNLKEMANAHFGFLIDDDANFNKRNEKAEALEALDYATFKQAIMAMVSEQNPHRLTVLIEGQNPLDEEVK